MQCSSGGSPTPPTSVTTLAPTTTTTTAPAGIVLPSGMVCSPTPPPLWGLQLKIHAAEPGRFVLDSKPIVANIDNYCQRVIGHSGIFCETRVESDPQRKACDYLAVGQASNGRWGPTWYLDNVPCGTDVARCNNHATEQFLVIAKATGRYEACASDKAKVATDGTRCGPIDIHSLNP